MTAAAPQLHSLPPELYAYAGSAFAVVDLREYIAATEKLYFSYEGRLPEGLELNSSGFLQGRLDYYALQTSYSINVIVSDMKGESLHFPLKITVLEAIELGEDDLKGLLRSEDFTGEKAKVWQAILDGVALPKLSDLFSDAVLASDVDYIYRRFGAISVWQADGQPNEDGSLMQLNDSNEHYNIYDFGDAIIGTPKQLYSSERSMAAGIQTARAMVQYAHNKEWHVQLGGYRSLVDAAWNEVQNLNLQRQHQMEVRNFMNIIPR